MATGDDALAAGMALVAGTVAANTIDTEINLTRDYIAQRTSVTLSVLKGGTGATNTAGARTNLGISAANTPSLGVLGTGTSQVQADLEYLQAQKLDKTAAQYNADFAARDAAIASKVNRSGDTMSGDLWIPGASAATSGFTAAYFNFDGRLGRGSSSERYKENITDLDPATLGDVFPQLREYEMIGGDGTRYVGYIAEELAENPDTDRFVVRYGDPERIESIEFNSFLMAQNASLNARLVALEARVSALEEPTE